MKNKIIKDIRIYESNQPNNNGNALPRELGKIYISSPLLHFSATRIARKLNELEFTLNESDHLYINFTTVLPPNEIEISDRKPASWIQYVNIGLNQNSFYQISKESQDKLMINLIFKALNLIASESEFSKIKQCESDLEKMGKHLTIKFKTKQTTQYAIVVSYQIAPEDEDSLLIIQYQNRKNNHEHIFRQPIRFYEDAYSLVDKISVKNNRIEIQPKKSEIAMIETQYYTTPLVFNLPI